MDEYIIKDGQHSYSSVSQYWKCPKAYDYRYRQKVKRIHAYEAFDPLLLGSTLHKGMEFDFKTAEKFYYDHFCILDDYQVNEMIKLEYWINKGHELLLEWDILHKEYEISTDDYRGTVDLIVDNNDGTVDLVDFKYCAESSIEHYIYSEQLHLYKYFLEETTDYKVRDLKFVIFPKLFTRQKNGEDIYTFRQRMRSDLSQMNYKIIRIDYLEDMLALFAKKVKTLEADTEFKPNRGENCKYCVYHRICNGKDDYNMLLPKNEPVDIGMDGVHVLWLYGPSFVGKTTGIDGYNGNAGFPNPINLNTDGNTMMVRMPRLKIENKVDVTGRKKNITLAWTLFKQAIDELKQSDEGFETLVLDLTEDLFEFSRLFIYDRDQIEHEADNSMKYYDIVRTEFLSTIRDCKSIPGLKWIVMISHEDHSRDIMKKSGSNITAIKPNINDKVARKLAGMSSAVARVMVKDDGSRVLNFKTDEVIFGGGRLDIKDVEIPWTYSDVKALFDSAVNKKQQPVTAKPEPAKEEKKGRKSRSSKDTKEEMFDRDVGGIVDRDYYMYHPESGSYWMLKKGEELKPSQDASLSHEVTKEEYDKGIQAEKAAEEPKEEKPKRERKSRGQKAKDEHDEKHPMPEAPEGIPVDWPENGLVCSQCGEPQYDSPSGAVCVNGHGGVAGMTRDAWNLLQESIKDEARQEPEKTEEPKRRRRRRS